MSILFFNMTDEQFADPAVYGVPVLSYSGSDFEKLELQLLHEAAYRTPAVIRVPYAPARKVKSMEGWYFEATFMQTERGKPGAFLPSIRNIYDARGRIVEKYEYGYFNDGVSVGMSYYYRFAWNDQDRLVEYQSYNPTGNMLEWRKFEYDAAGNLVAEDRLPGAVSKARYSWTGDGKLAIKTVAYSGKYKNEYVATYKSGKLMEEKNFIANYGDVRNRVTYRYDAAGRMSEKKVVQVEPPADVQKEVYTRDASGRIIQLDHYDKWQGEEVYLTWRVRYRYAGDRWTEELHFGPDDVATKSLLRTYDAAGHLVRQDVMYHDSDYGGPVERYVATYDAAGNLVEETRSEIDSETNKLRVIDRIVLSWAAPDRVSSWETSRLDSDGKMNAWERRRFLYDTTGNLIRDEYWYPEGDKGKLALKRIGMYRYDGVDHAEAHPEHYPVVSNRMEFECLGPWNPDDSGEGDEYRFKK